MIWLRAITRRNQYMTIEIIINIDTNELKELEENKSALVAFILENQSNTKVVGENLKLETQVKTKHKLNQKNADKAEREQLKIAHQQLAEIVRNSPDLMAVKTKAKELSVPLKRNEIIALATDTAWLKKHKLPRLPDDDDVFRMSNDDFITEIHNHFKHRLQSVASGQESHLEVHFSATETSHVEYANWRKSVCDEITAGKKFDSTERYKQIDDIVMKIVKTGRNILGPATSWSIIVMDNDLGFVVLQQGAESILAR